MNTMEKVARRVLRLEREVKALGRTPQLAYSSVEDGTIDWNVGGQQAITVGPQYDGTNGVNILTGPTPPEPTPPLVLPVPGGVKIYWDGTWMDDETDTLVVAPLDFTRITVHAVPLDVFVDPDPLDATRIVGSISSATGGEISVSLTPVEHAFYTVAWTTAGKFSAVSNVTLATPEDPATYIWVKYATSATPSAASMSDEPTGMTHVGLAFNKHTPAESPDPADYQWSAIQGPAGPAGSQGIAGPPGADGTSLYTWLKYADNAAGAGMSDDPTGKAYIGFAYNKTSPFESNNPGDYAWSLTTGPQGDQGIPGPAGANGVTTYTWVKYANDSAGGGMSDSPTGKTYIGLAFNKTTAAESTNVTDYQWSLIQGPQGSQGIQGPAGPNGLSLFTWLKYAPTATPSAAQMSDDPTGMTYIGLAYNKTSSTESTNPADYSWALIQGPVGPTGSQGIPGPTGPNGQTTYTWIKYGTSATGAGLSDDPTGRPYIGIAYNKLTQTESTVASDYTWSLIQGPQGPQGSQGLQGPAGANGVSLYTWLKYADTPTSGMSDSPVGKTYMGIAYNKTSSTESTVYTDYDWSLIQGPQGNQGIPGPTGASGQTTYTWVKYAPNGTPTSAQMSDTPGSNTYIGLSFNQTSATESNNPADYQWSLIQGPQGPVGSQGIQGPAGANGQSLYTWLKYADTPASGMSDSPTGKTYMGVAYNKATPTESNVYSDYEWSLIQGPQGVQGIQGPAGANGTTTYTWVKYATSSTGAGMQDSPTGMTYIGLAFNKTTATQSNVASDYQWSLIQGPQGSQGIQGPVGPNGQSLYTWIKYAPNATPTAAQMTDSPTGMVYMGIAYNKTSSVESTVYTDYDWSLIQGPQGNQGIQGPVGPNGAPTYTWIKYGDSATGAGLSDSPTGKTYIGIAYNKLTQTESTVATDYEWSLIQGPQGSQGIQGPAGPNGSSLYTWIKYAPNATPSAAQMTDDPTGQTWMGIAYNKSTAIESTVYTDYSWSLIQGPQGPTGSTGAAGKGVSSTVVTYQVGTSATTPPSGTWSTPIVATTAPGQYLWTKTFTTYTDGSTSTSYSISAHGATGPTGSTGAAGRGISSTAVDYQVSSSGTVTPGSTGWSASIPATSAGQYLWTRTTATYTDGGTATWYSVAKNGDTGAQGIQGPTGPNGAPTYTWVKYATDASGSSMSDDPTGRSFIGFAYNKLTATESTIPSDYSWSQILGPQGPQGIQGPAGPNGVSLYTWIKYADTPTSGMTDTPTGKTYMGIAYNKTTPTESNVYTDYDWSLIVGPQGPQGSQGIQGPTGSNGQPTYTWIKYATSATGAGLSDSPTGMTYIGIAYNKLTQTESNVATDYEWSLIQGPQGPTGTNGSNGVSITAVTPYYAVVTTGAAAPANPGTVATPPAPWVATEPSYAANTELYRTDRISFSNNTYTYTTVTKSSSYTAATQALDATKVPVTSSPTPVVIGGIGTLQVVFPTTNGSNVVVDVYISTVSGTTGSLAKTVSGTSTTISAMPDGTALAPDTNYYVSVQARNAVSTAALSSQAVGQLRKVDTADVSAQAAWVGTMTVDRLTGGTLEAETYIAGEGGYIARGLAGEEVSLRGTGFQVKGATSLGNPIYVDFPTDGGKPNIISGVLEATTLKVLGDPTTQQALSLMGISEMATGATLRLNMAPQPSVSAPIVSEEWATTAITGVPSDTYGYNNGAYYDASTGYMYQIVGSWLIWYNASTMAYVGRISLTYKTPGGGGAYGITKQGGYWYIIYSPSTSNGQWSISKLDSAWNVVTSAVLFNQATVYGHVAIASNGTTLYTVSQDGLGGNLKVRTIDPTSLAVTSTNTVTLNGATANLANLDNPSITDADAGTYDFGGARIVVAVNSTSLSTGASNPRALVINPATWALVTTEEFPIAPKTQGLKWDGTRFRSNANGWTDWTQTLYSTDKYTTESSKWWFVFSKRDNAGPYETAISPAVSLTRSRRKGYRVTLSHGDTPSARVYVGRGATQPANTSMFLVQDITGTTFFKNDATAFSGTTPTTIAFPNSTPSQITSADGSTYWKADGNSKFFRTIIASTTDASTAAGNLPPLRVGDIAGLHLRIDGNEIIAMDSDSVQGTLNLNLGGLTKAASGAASARFQIGGGDLMKHMAFGQGSGTTDATGSVTFTHSMGFGTTTYAAKLTPRSVANPRVFTITNKTANAITFRVDNPTTGAALGSGVSISFDYILVGI